MKSIILTLLLAASPALAQQPPAGPPATADHIAINAVDPEASARFYRQAFAMTDLPTKLPNTRWLAIGNNMALHIIGGRTAPVASNRFVHLAVRTDDLAKSIAYFDAANIPWSDFTGKPRAIQTRFDGIRQIFVRDPDGYFIEVSDARGQTHDGALPRP